MGEAVRAITEIDRFVGKQCRMRRHYDEVAALDEHPRERKGLITRLASVRYGATDPRAPFASRDGPHYFPNAFLSSGSISPLAAIGSSTSVSP